MALRINRPLLKGTQTQNQINRHLKVHEATIKKRKLVPKIISKGQAVPRRLSRKTLKISTVEKWAGQASAAKDRQWKSWEGDIRVQAVKKASLNKIKKFANKVSAVQRRKEKTTRMQAFAEKPRLSHWRREKSNKSRYNPL